MEKKRLGVQPPNRIPGFILHFPLEPSYGYLRFWRKWENSFGKVGKNSAQLAVSVYYCFVNNWNIEWKFVKTHTVRFCGLDWCRPCRQGSLFIRHNTFSQTILFSCPVVHYVILYFIYSHDLPTYWKVIITNHMIWHSDLNLRIVFGNCGISIWCT